MRVETERMYLYPLSDEEMERWEKRDQDLYTEVKKE